MSVQFSADYPTLTVEVGFALGVSSSEWDTALFDTATFSTDTVWHDISSFVRRLSTNRARSRETERYSGSATLTLDNRDARFTPGTGLPLLTESSTELQTETGLTIFVEIDPEPIAPRVPIRATAEWNSVVYPLFYGYAEDWRDEYIAEGKDAVTHVPLSDGWSNLAAFDGYEQTSVGGGETSGRRMQRILQNLDWALATDIEDGVVTLQATTLAANASTEALLTADSEGGAAWVEADGSFVFEGRHALIEHTRSSTSQVTFGTGGVSISDPVTTQGSDMLRNDIAMARAGSTVQTATDETSVGRYGRRRHSRTDLVCETDTQVAGLVGLSLAKWKDPEYRVERVTVFPAKAPSTAWPHVLGRRIRDRAEVSATVPVSGKVLEHSVFIEGVSHDISPMRWVSQFSFSSTTAYDDFTTSLWDTGVFDTATFFY